MSDDPTGRDIGIGIRVLCWAGGIALVVLAGAWAVLVIVWPWAVELRDNDNALRFRVESLERGATEKERRLDKFERRIERLERTGK